MKKLIVAGAAAVAASTIGLLNAGLASADPVNPSQLNVIGEPYYKAVKILHGMGLSTTFGGSVGSDLPQAQCMVASQKMLGSGRMQMNLDCTEAAAQEMAESGSMGGGGGVGPQGTLRPEQVPIAPGSNVGVPTSPVPQPPPAG